MLIPYLVLHKRAENQDYGKTASNYFIRYEITRYLVVSQGKENGLKGSGAQHPYFG